MRASTLTVALLGLLGTASGLRPMLGPARRAVGRSHRGLLRASASESASPAAVPEPVVVAAAPASQGVELRGALSVLGGVMSHLVLGTMYCWGNFLTYAPESLLFMDGLPHPGMTPDAIQVMPLALVALTFGMPAGARVMKKFGPRITALTGCSLMVLGTFIGSFQTRLAPFLLSYSLLAGFGTGMSYTTPMIAGWSWFPENKGLINGLTLMGFGAGAFVFNRVGTNLYQSGMPWMAMIQRLAAIYAALSLTGAAFIKDKPPSAAVKAGSPGDDTCEVDWCEVPGAGFREGVTSLRFALLWIIGLTTFTPGLTVLGLYKRFAAASGAVLAGDRFQSTVGGLGALSNGLGRVFWGRMIDKIGFNAGYTITTATTIGVLLALPFTVGSKLAFGAAICATLFSLGGNIAMFATVNAQIFGVRNAGEIYSVLFGAFAVAAIGGAQITKVLLSRMGWAGVFKVMAAACAGAIGLLQLLKKERQKPAPWD